MYRDHRPFIVSDINALEAIALRDGKLRIQQQLQNIPRSVVAFPFGRVIHLATPGEPSAVCGIKDSWIRTDNETMRRCPICFPNN